MYRLGNIDCSYKFGFLMQDTEKLRKSFAHYPNDTLMFPLEPVRENLDDATYKEFEKDRVKYELYETAVTRALSDVAQKQPKDVDIQ